MTAASIRRNRTAYVTVLALAMTACGGGGGSTETSAEPATSTFRAYAQQAGAGGASSTPAPLSAADQAEVANQSRRWAANTLVTGNSQTADNAVTLPPLYFARLQAVASAASGATLAELRKDAPVPSNAAVAAALMKGTARTVSAKPEYQVTKEFMRNLTAADQADTLTSLKFNELSEAALAREGNLRLMVVDDFDLSMPWQRATVFDGVFDAGSGKRTQASMVRLTGALHTFSDASMQAIAMAAPQGRWLVRITPTGLLSSWTADDLAAALANVTSAVGNSSVPAVEGELVLPVLSDFRARGMDDVRGMQSAQDQVRADLRALDGHGGTFASLPPASATLSLGTQVLSISGLSSTSFVFSPRNEAGMTYGNGQTSSESRRPVCNVTDLRPAYLAVINSLGGVDMLARFMSMTSGYACN